ncbi:MAG TPA: metallophosphoesterase, partial [Polyangiaceae bacterium]|nr:metallophosphoesterase [Polyangiaceae bacterium]
LAGRHDYQLEDVPLRLPGLSRALDGFTIVQLSDIHIGQFVGDAELAAAEALVRRARPDLIVLTGDLLDHDVRYAQQLGRFARKLGGLAREGVVAISGNHDFYAGIQETMSALEAGGADVMRNRGRIIGGRAGFALLGVDDVWGRRFGMGPNLKRAVATLPPIAGSVAAAQELPRVLLCHNPSFFEAAAPQVGLQLSGHTHGGQINLVVRPADWLLKNGWVAGLYRERGSQLYVNRGFGTAGPPARIGSPPEVTRIILTT